MHRLPKPSLPARALTAVALVLAACQSPGPTTTTTTSPAGAPPSARIAQEMTTTAQVMAVEPSARVVTLRNEAGRILQVRAGEAVRNLDQVQVGDILRVRYQASMTASLLPAGEALQPLQGAAAVGRAPKGAKPAGAVGVAVSVRVKIESIDAPRDIVVFSSAAGELIAHRIATEAGREFVGRLKVGDVVQIDYDEVVGLGIEKVTG